MQYSTRPTRAVLTVDADMLARGHVTLRLPEGGPISITLRLGDVPRVPGKAEQTISDSIAHHPSMWTGDGESIGRIDGATAIIPHDHLARLGLTRDDIARERLAWRDAEGRYTMPRKFGPARPRCYVLDIPGVSEVPRG